MKRLSYFLFLIVFLFVIIGCSAIIFDTNVYGTTSIPGVSDPSRPSDISGPGDSYIINIANNIWGSLGLIFQIAAFSGIIASGVRYMFASADQRADIKGQTIYLVLGCILVFGAVSFARWIQGIGFSLL